MAQAYKDDLPDELSEIFFAAGLDSKIADLPFEAGQELYFLRS
jgi:hypothetical protein